MPYSVHKSAGHGCDPPQTGPNEAMSMKAELPSWAEPTVAVGIWTGDGKYSDFSHHRGAAH